LARAAGTLPECRRKERPPGVFHLHERGAGWSRTRTRTRAVSEILHPPQFFGQIFWEKILEIKIVLFSIPEERVLRVGRSDSARSDSGSGTHYLPRDPRRNASSGEKDEACANAGIAKVAASLN